MRTRSMRLQGVSQSALRHMTQECKKVSGINLGEGICDLPTPLPATNGAAAALREGQNAYSAPEGEPALRETIAKKLSTINGVSADPHEEVTVTTGASAGFASAVLALLNPGDRALLFEPYYPYHLDTLRLAQIEPRFLRLHPPGFLLTEEALRDAACRGLDAIILCNPANPCGKVFAPHEVALVSRIAVEFNLLVITDEVYEAFTYDGRLHLSPRSLSAMKPRVVSVMSVSKTFSMTGWRLGYVVAPPAMSEAIRRVNELYAICAPTPLQIGAISALSLGPAYYDALRTAYQAKRDSICDALSSAGMPAIVPEGAYYVLADITDLDCGSSLAAAMELLHLTGVAAVPGSAFYRGTAGDAHLRFCFAKPDDVLAEACTRISAFPSRRRHHASAG